MNRFKFGFLRHPKATFDSLMYCDESAFLPNSNYIDPDKIPYAKKASTIAQYIDILNLSEEFLFDFFEQYHPEKKHAGMPEWCFDREYNDEVLEKVNSFLMASKIEGN